METGANSENHKELSGQNSGIIEVKRDRISDLPDDVLRIILSSSSLNIREVVRTRCLSSRWRHICAFTSRLYFDWNLMFFTPTFTRTSKLYCQHCRFNRPQHRLEKDRFVQAVGQFLKTYQDNKITSFTLDFCLGPEYSTHIDQWVSFALQRGVKNLVLKLSCRAFTPINETGSGSGSGSGSDTTSLEYLELKSCTLSHINTGSRFGSLTTLLLGNVDVGQEVLQAISCSCFKLKHLSIVGCKLDIRTHFSNEFLSLETLVVHKSLVFETFADPGRIEVSAAKLTSFHYGGNFRFLSFSGVPSLQYVYMTVCWGYILEQDLRYLFTQFGNHVPGAVRFLSVCASRPLSVPSASATIDTFKIKQLVLSFFHQRTEFDMLRVIDILRAFPLLQKFELEAWWYVNDHTKQGRYIVGDGEYQVQHLRHLEEVEIRGFHGTQNQIDFAIYLLKYAISLKRLILKPGVQIFRERDYFKGSTMKKRVSWNEGEREKVCQALQHFFQEDIELIIAP